MEKEQDTRQEKRTHVFNFVTICLIWLFIFTAYSGLQNLEAAVNAEIGLYSLAAVTSGGVISCIVAPTVISFIGSKGALIVACICQCIFVAANFYPKPEILITAGAINGLSTGLLWTAQSCYVTMISVEYHKLSGESLDTLLSRFFGIFFMAFQSSQVWGNLISSAVFQSEGASKEMNNNTFCGASFCPSHQNVQTNSSEPIVGPDKKLERILIWIYLGCTIVGLLLTIFVLKPIKSSVSDKYVSLRDRLMANGKIIVSSVDMLLLIPFALYMGQEQVLMFAEFTTAFTACKLGVEWIGFTMICFGVSDTLANLLVAIVAKYTGRLPLFIMAAVLNASVLVFLRLWRLEGETYFSLFFIIPALWGLSDAVWQSQSDALVGAVFHDNPEVAFSNYLMFQALGLAIAYLYNIYLCEDVKLYILGTVLVITMSLLCLVEFRFSRRKNKGDKQKE